MANMVSSGKESNHARAHQCLFYLCEKEGKKGMKSVSKLAEKDGQTDEGIHVL